MTIGILVAELMDPYQQDLLKGIREEAEEHKIKLICFLSGALQHNYATFLDRNRIISEISSEIIDGLIIFSGPVGMSCGIEGLKKLITDLGELPILSIGVEIPGTPSLCVDNYNGFYKLVSHFLNEHNVRSPGFLTGPKSNIEVTSRIKAFRAALEDNGKIYDENYIVEGNFVPGDGVKGVETLLLERDLEIDCLICTDDITAVEAMSRLESLGYKIPEDILIGGFDDEVRGQYYIPSLSTVRQSPIVMGREAVNTAVNQIMGKKVPLFRELESSVILRESCGCSKTAKAKGQSDDFNLSVNDDIIDIVDQAADAIAGKHRQTGIEEISKVDYESNVSQAAEVIKTFLQKKEISSSVPRIRTIMIESFKLGYTASYWSDILDEFNHILPLKAPMEKVAQSFREFLLICKAELFKTEFRLSSFNNLDLELLNGYMIRLGDRLLTSFTHDDIKTVLKEDLSKVHIKELVILLREEASEKQEYFFSQGVGHEDLKDCACLKDFMKKLPDDNSWVIISLSADRRVVGTILISLIDIPYSFYEYIGEKVAASLKNTELMNKLNNYTHYLEQRVSHRTRELEEANERLFTLSHKDQLTGLFNRRYLNEYIQKHIEDSMRFAGKGLHSDKRKRDSAPLMRFALIMVDIDHFKAVNDAYGHGAGDKVLVDLGRIFLNSCRENDYVVRMGGEEFLLIFADFDEKTLKRKIEKIREHVENHTFDIGEGIELKKTCSLGAVMYPPISKSPGMVSFAQTVEIADRCLYRAKETGRNKSCIAAPAGTERKNSELATGDKKLSADQLLDLEFLKIL